MSVLRTGRGLDRLVNFSDATVAIAITLLILPLVDEAGDIAQQSVSEFAAHHLSELLAFAISFVVIGRFWAVHHQVFEWVDRYSKAMIWANSLWLGSIVFIPFAANLLAKADGSRADVNAVYIGTMIVTSAAMFVIELILVRNPELMREDARGSLDLLRSIPAPALMAVALVLAVSVPQVGLWWLLLLFLSTPLHRLLRKIVPGRRP